MDKEIEAAICFQMKGRLSPYQGKTQIFLPTSGMQHDVWSVYAYGEVLRFVYIKARKGEKRDADALYGLQNSNPRENAKNAKFGEIEAENGKNSGEIFKNAQKDSEQVEQERFSASISRTKSRIFELAACNRFTHFCTFTVDETKHDRVDLAKLRKDFAQFIRNQNRGRGEKIKYLIVPEEHKKGGWHLHGLLCGLTAEDLRPFGLSERIPKRIKDTIRGGKQVYEWENYSRRFGFFTATEINDPTSTAKYITKYITKGIYSVTARAAGEHLFFASQGLRGRETLLKNAWGVCPITQWQYENDYCKIAEVRRNEVTPDIVTAIMQFEK